MGRYMGCDFKEGDEEQWLILLFISGIMNDGTILRIGYQEEY